MAGLQRINWTQIDSSNVPSGSTIDLGSLSTPIDGTYTETLFIGESGNEEVLHNFFWYLTGFTGNTGTSGTSGTSGISGSAGTSGTSGASGSSGSAGSHGTSGTSGFSGDKYRTTSSTELTISGGTQTLIVGTGLSFIPGQSLIIAKDGSNYMEGTVDSYNPSTGELIGIITTLSGSGINNNWYVNLGGAQGADGTSGSSGTSGTDGTGISIVVDNNTGLGITTGLTEDTLYTIYNTTLSPSLTVPATVGGITSGTSVAQLTGKTVVELFNDLLFPTVLPTYTIPIIVITGPSTTTVEAGSTYAPNINVYGTKNDAGIYTQLRILRNASPILTDTTLTESSATDIADQYGYVDSNNPNHTYTISPTPYSESYIIPSGATSTTTYYGDGNYDAGLAKQNNKGDLDIRAPAIRSSNAPQAAGSNFATTTYTITGIFPYFYGVSDTLPDINMIASAISGGTATKVVSNADGTLSIPYNITGKFIWFAYQNTYTTKTVWYVNALDTSIIDGSFISTVATKTVNSPNNYWTGITFKMHWSVYATTQTTIEFRNS